MPSTDDIRKQILVSIRTDSEGAASRAAQEIAALKAQLAALEASFNSGNKVAKEYRTEQNALVSDLKAMTRVFDEATEAVRQADPEWKRLQATLGAMNERTIKDTAEAAALLKSTSLESVGYFNDRAKAARTAAEAQETANQAVREWAAVQAKLGAMESRDHEDRAVEAARKYAEAEAEKKAAIERSSEAVRDWIALQAHLGTMDARDYNERAIEVTRRLTEADNQEREATQRRNVAQQELRQTILETARAIDSTRGPITRTSAGLDATAGSSGRAGYAFLNLAHAIQDAQYGFGALLNNIPLVVTSMGGSAGLAGGLMVAGVAASVASNHMGSLAAQLGLAQDATKNAGTSVADLKAKLEALQAKGFKFQADFSAIDEAARKIAHIEEALRAFDAGKMTSKTRFAASLGADAVDKAGGSEVLMKAAGDYYASKGVSFANANDERNFKTWDQAATSAEKRGDTVAASLARKNADEIAQRIQQDQAEAIKALVGKFAMGDQLSVSKFQHMNREIPGLFGRNASLAIGSMPNKPEELDSMFAMAEQERKEALRLAKEAKEAAEAAQRKRQADDLAKREEDKALAARNQEVTRDASNFGNRFAKTNETNITRGLAAGRSPQDIQASLLGPLTNDLRSAGVKAEAVDDVAKLILKQAVERVTGSVIGSDVAGTNVGIAETAKTLLASDEAKDQAKAERQAEAEGRRAGRQGKADNRDFIESELTRNFPVSAEQAHTIAPDVDRLMQSGVNPQTAAEIAIAKLGQHIQSQHEIMIATYAQMEQLSGEFGPYSEMLQQQRMMQTRFNANLNRTAGGAAMPMAPAFSFGY